MEFPKVWDTQEWKVIKKSEELWATSSGDNIERLLGSQTLYQGIRRPNEIVREINIYWRGAVGRIWYKFIDKHLIVVASQLMAEGQWVTGMPGEEIKISVIKLDNQYIGVALHLQVERDQPPVKINVFRNRHRRL
ncbi:MAG: hypothetical protein HZB99_02005 [Candidatus Harrisonbacteria bacterium]|nr:hypothetical protein [Candidatus Harrisonbacteria bacterium]